MSTKLSNINDNPLIETNVEEFENPTVTIGIQKSEVSLINVEAGDRNGLFAIEIDKGKISHPILGTAEVKAHFYMFLKPGQYLFPTKEDLKSTDKFMMDWAISHKLLEKGTRSCVTFAKGPSYFAMYLVPSMKLNSKEWEIFCKLAVVYWGMDDYLDDEVGKGEMSFSDLDQLADAIQSILYGNCKSSLLIPKLKISFFNYFLAGFYEIYRDIVELVKDYKENCAPFVSGIGDWIRSVKMFAGINGEDWKGDNGYTLVRLESGQRVVFEAWCIINQTFVNKEIRSSLPFRIFFDCGSVCANFSNDIYSLEKEIKNNEFSCNLVGRKVLLEGNTLQQSIKVVQDINNNCVLDLLSAAKILKKEYPSDKALKNYMDDYMMFCDGCYFMYAEHPSRYGPCRWSIKKVIFN